MISIPGLGSNFAQWVSTEHSKKTNIMKKFSYLTVDTWCLLPKVGELRTEPAFRI